MVSFKEQVARIKKEFNFNHNELSGLIIGMIVFGFIFSFKYWGTQKFDWIYGLKNLVLITLAAGISPGFYIMFGNKEYPFGRSPG